MMTETFAPDEVTPTVSRCLVVDDEPMLAELVALALADPGRRDLRVCESGDATLRAFEEADEPVDLLITDFDMPGMNGIDLARRVRNRSPRTRILMMTGSTDFLPDVIHCPDLDAVVPKPFSIDRLEEVVGKMLAGVD
jgi:DNA-binding response OmpR family regulator